MKFITNIIKGRYLGLSDRIENDKIEVVNCNDCGCTIEKDRAQKVEWYVLGKTIEYYCGKCKKPYRKIFIDPIGKEEPTYYSEIEVDKNGSPVGYKKIVNNKINICQKKKL